MESWDDQPCELIAYLTEDLEDDTTSTGAGSASFDHGCADMCLAYDGSEDSLADEIDDEKGPACAASPHVQGHVADSTIGATSAGVSSTEDARAGRDQPHGFTEHAFKAAAGAWERCLQSVAIQPRDEKHVRSVGHSATEPVVALDDIPAILDEQKEAITAAVFDAWDPAPIVAKREQLLGLYKLLQGTGYDSLIMESYVAMLREVLERGLRRLQVQEHRFCTYPICAKNACGRETAGELVSKVEKYMSAVDPQWTAPARQEWCNGVDGQLDGYFDPNM
ncbi:hypothetical protein KEM52_005424 [Ascosphaera acerosa]|nr:hypothetical protein KEM52_005424 [Ascosphaera acerosa]